MKLIEPDLVLYGGAFDPPHNGHVSCVEQVLETSALTQILIMPGFVPAGAKGLHKHPEASYEQRLEMSNLAFSFSSRISVSDIEATLPTPNYTYRTLSKLRSDFPDKRLGILIGLDQFKVFNRWQSPKDILEFADLFVVRRDSKESIVSIADYIFSNLGLGVVWDEAYSWAKITGTESFLRVLQGATSPAASSEIRFRVQHDSEVPETWIDSGVRRYIKENKLYMNMEKSGG